MSTRDLVREAAQHREKRRLRKDALLRIAGATCSRCPAPTWGLAAPDSSAYGDPSRAHDQGPSDRGLTARAGRVFEAAANRIPLCRSCMTALQNARRAGMRRAS